jgi:hypothetical protein
MGYTCVLGLGIYSVPRALQIKEGDCRGPKFGTLKQYTDAKRAANFFGGKGLN